MLRREFLAAAPVPFIAGSGFASSESEVVYVLGETTHKLKIVNGKLKCQTSIKKDESSITWYNNEGLVHREDGPAIYNNLGILGVNKYWYLNGTLHREDGPAVECTSDEKQWYIQWYINGKLHREDGPAIEYADGSKAWYLNGVLHREDGPAMELVNGSKHWYLNGKLHRKDGPAVLMDQNLGF